MNIDRLRKVRKLIEAQHDGLEFNMRHVMDPWLHPCATVACIAGYTLLAQQIEEGFSIENGIEEVVGSTPTTAAAREWLEIQPHVEGILFVPIGASFEGRGSIVKGGWNHNARPDEPGYITREHAVRTLKYIEGGGLISSYLWKKTDPAVGDAFIRDELAESARLEALASAA